MEATAKRPVPTMHPVVLNVSVEDMTVARDIKRFLRHMHGVTKVTVPRRKPQTRLFDPETGKYLNDETMLAIEDAHKGIGVTSYSSFEEFEKAMRAL